MRALHYDAVYNGNELGSGSIRITDPELQLKIFDILGIPPHEAQRRFVDEPGHERKIEKSCREAAVGRDHAIARVEGAPLETHRLAARAIRQWRGRRLDDHMRSLTIHGRERAAESNGLRPQLAARLAVRVDALTVQKVERDEIDALDRPPDEVLAGLLDASREELEWIEERGRPRIRRIYSREGEAEPTRDLLDLLGARELAAKAIEIDRRDDQRDDRTDRRENEYQRHDMPFCSRFAARRCRATSCFPERPRPAGLSYGSLRRPPSHCGDGGGSNSPSKACARIASTSVVGDFDLAERGAHRHAPRSRQVGSLEPAYRPVGGPQLRLYRPSRPAERRPGGRLTD